MTSRGANAFIALDNICLRKKTQSQLRRYVRASARRYTLVAVELTTGLTKRRPVVGPWNSATACAQSPHLLPVTTPRSARLLSTVFATSR